MSESTSTSETEPIAATAEPVAVEAVQERRPSRLNQVAAWVGIVAGAVFIVAVIFGSGFFLGLVTGHGHGGHGGHHRDGESSWHHHGPPPGLSRPGQGFGPGGPAFGPGAPAFGPALAPGVVVGPAPGPGGPGQGQQAPQPPR